MDLEKVHVKKEGDNPFVFCDNFINEKQHVYFINKVWGEKILKSLKHMDCCISALTNNEEVTEFDYAPIEECLNFLTSLTVEKEESPKLAEFISNYIHLAHNVNENTIKHKTITKKISYLKRYADRCLTMSEAMSLMRKCSLRMARFKEFELPPYRLSEHYYKLIKEE